MRSFSGIKASIIGMGHTGDFVENGAKMLLIFVAHLIGYLSNAFGTIFKQLLCTRNPSVNDKILDGASGLFRENPAQIIR